MPFLDTLLALLIVGITLVVAAWSAKKLIGRGSNEGGCGPSCSCGLDSSSSPDCKHRDGEKCDDCPEQANQSRQ
ncbi:MAG: hypothetical protein ACLFUS_17680 [Candidatus Sumerlaeia bacterium]